MSGVKLAKGRNFVSKYYPDMKLATIRSVENFNGTTFVVYERTYVGAYRTVKTIEVLEKADFLVEFTEKEDFFVEGGVYEYSNGVTMYVKEVFTISNPISQKYRKQARAVIINRDGTRYMEMLDGYHFPDAKRVK